MPFPNTRNVKLQWLPFSSADSYRIERKLTSESVYTLVDTVTVSPFIDLSVPNDTYDYRMTALDGATELAQKVKQITVTDILEMPGPPSLWFDVIDRTAFSLGWDTTNNPDYWILNTWRQRDWTFGDPASPRWTADSAYGPILDLSAGNNAFFGSGYPVFIFENSALSSVDVPDQYMNMADPPDAFEPPCTVLMSISQSYDNNNDPRCLLQLGKLAFYSSTGAGQQLGLRVDGGFVTSDLNIDTTVYLVAVVAHSETNIDFHRINTITNTWTSDLGVSGGAWENHGEFSLGSMLTAPYHRNRFLTAGVAAWNEALTLLELKRAVNFMVNYNNLHHE